MAIFNFKDKARLLFRSLADRRRGTRAGASGGALKMTDEDDVQYEAFFRACGGRFPRAQVEEGSTLAAALKIGEQCAQRGLSRVEKGGPLNVQYDLVLHRSMNATAARLSGGYGIAVYVPLIFTIQGLAATIWASGAMALHVGDTEPLLGPELFEGTLPAGFDFYRTIIGAQELERGWMRAGVRRDCLNAIIAAGQGRVDAFNATWRAGIEFVFHHEFAHILYGHVDLTESLFGVNALYENGGERETRIPDHLAQYLEHEADMDATMQIYGDLYGQIFEKERPPAYQDQLNGGTAALGIMIAIFVLEIERRILSRTAISSTHPPLKHRAMWVLAGESSVLRRMEDHIRV